jgi:tRNA 2-thiouridine synthesizing protein E
MSIEVNGKTIQTDEEGFLVNLTDWNENIAAAIAKADGIVMTDSHWGLVEAARIHFDDKQRHPSGNELVHWLGKHIKENSQETRHNVNEYLYQLFPKGPDKQLAKIAGLPKPLPADTE